jgi:ZIP family zinc transporter
MDYQVGTAFLLTAAAGLSTTIGSGLALLVRQPGAKLMGFALGFSAGVMVLISFVELLPGSIQSIGFLPAHAGLLAGMAGFLVIDMLIPHDYVGEHDHHETPEKRRLMRVGMLLMLGIGIHNVPEGMVTFVGALQDAHLGLAIAIAIAIHNIPEGLAVAAPVYAATGSRRKAFLWSFLSGVSEPVGAALAALILLPFLSASVLGWVLAVVAGIMIAISLDELIPVARSFKTEHSPILGVMTGMGVMALSLWILK